MEVKFIILAILLSIFLSSWFISKSSLRNKINMDEKLFLVVNLVLLFFSICGFVLTIFLGDAIMSSHVFEIILLPVLFAFVLTGLSKKDPQAEEKYDEKQIVDMRNAVTVSWISVIATSFVLYAMYSAGNIVGLIFFPIIIFVAMITYAGSLLYFFKMS